MRSRLPSELATQSGPGEPDRWPEHELETVDHCPLCGCCGRAMLYQGLADRVFFCAPGKWTLYRCTTCNSGYLDPRPTVESIGRAYASYYTHEPAGDHAHPIAVRGLTRVLRDNYAALKRAVFNDYLNAHYNLVLRPTFRWIRWAISASPRRRLNADLLARHLVRKRPGARLLDIGCGNGAFVGWARACGWEAEGLDPDPRAAEAGRALGMPITVGSLPDTGFPEARFAAVTMSHSIEHLHDPVAGLREVYRILEPGGTVWIATPNFASVGHELFGSDWLALDSPRHLVLFTASALISTLSAIGFVAIRPVRRPPIAEWYFRTSHRVALREDPFSRDGSELPFGLKLRAVICDWQALLCPTRGEEIIVIAERQQ
jgi:SAM-dependent methyltransferase